MKFTKKDLIFSIITGLIAGTIVWRIFIFLDFFDVLSKALSAPSLNLNPAIMIVAIPLLWILGVNLGYFLGKWIGFFNQFGRFAAIGFTNAAVDFGILNLLIAYTGIAGGPWYSGFKAISFFGALIHSYAWNKFWVFDSAESHGGGVEFAKFVTVSGIAIVINVGIASLVVNAVHPVLGIGANGWANIGAVAGAAVGLLFSFVGYRLLVFKKKIPETTNVVS